MSAKMKGITPVVGKESVFDIWRRRHMARTAYNALDQESIGIPAANILETCRIKRQQDFLWAYEMALDEVVTLQPAVTLQDAAAHLSLLHEKLDFLGAVEMERSDLDTEILKLRRLAASCLLVVTEATGLELAAITEEHTADLCAREFVVMSV